MARIETIGDCTLYLGDCLEILPTLGKVDAVVTDPPYGIGADIGQAARAGKRHGAAIVASKDYGESNWDSAPPTTDFLSKLRAISRFQIIFGGNYFELPPARCWLIWDKENGTNDYADCEMAWTNLDKPVRRIYWMWHGMLRRGSDVREHPTQKPVGVMEWALGHLPDSHSVIDPFMGSGTTGVACVALSLKFTGIEREPKYFDISCRRIEEAYRQPRLFAEPKPKAVQEALL